jgi:glycosyltransferase involved in cell wall biosynthesis
MHIALDGMPLNQQLTGVGHYTLELARALAATSANDEYEVVSPLSFVPLAGETVNGELPNLRFVQAKVGVVSRHWWTVGLPRYVQKRSFDVFHGTNFEVPLWKKCATVLTIHDLSLLLHSHAHEQSRVRRARRRLPLMARAATMIVTPGESVRDEVIERLKIPSTQVVAIPEAARRVFHPMTPDATSETRQRLGIADEFLLYVGTIEPRKNLNKLVQAFVEIARTRKGSLQLVLAGREGWMTEELFELVRRSGMNDAIKFTGYLSDEDLRALYNSCLAFMYPSFYEGFGLPPLEAMACGAPVIAGRIPSVEAVTGSAACLIDPNSVSDLVVSIRELLNNEGRRRELSLAGLKRASEFSWERTAELTRTVYSEAVERFAKAN